MFWQLMMEPNKSYNQKPKTAFHISMALQDVRTSDGHPSQVFCIHKGQKYLLCTLQYPRVMQCTLDLYFDVGTEVTFETNGKGLIYLTGSTTE